MITFCLCCPLFNRLGNTIGKTITGLFREKKKKEKKKNHPYVTVLRTCSTNWWGGRGVVCVVGVGGLEVGD